MNAKQTLRDDCTGSGGFLSSTIKAIELLSGFIRRIYCTKVVDNKQEPAGLMSEQRATALLRLSNSSSCCLRAEHSKGQACCSNTEQTAQRRVGLFSCTHAETHSKSDPDTHTHTYHTHNACEAGGAALGHLLSGCSTVI